MIIIGHGGLKQLVPTAMLLYNKMVLDVSNKANCKIN